MPKMSKKSSLQIGYGAAVTNIWRPSSGLCVSTDEMWTLRLSGAECWTSRICWTPTWGSQLWLRVERWQRSQWGCQDQLCRPRPPQWFQASSKDLREAAQDELVRKSENVRDQKTRSECTELCLLLPLLLLQNVPKTDEILAEKESHCQNEAELLLQVVVPVLKSWESLILLCLLLPPWAAKKDLRTCHTGSRRLAKDQRKACLGLRSASESLHPDHSPSPLAWGWSWTCQWLACLQHQCLEGTPPWEPVCC